VHADDAVIELGEFTSFEASNLFETITTVNLK